MKLKEFPEKADLVVLKIRRIMPYGAVADLEEYPGKECFIHISNVANARIKNIRSYLSEGQLRAGYVLVVYPEKKSIDVSLRRISEQQQKRKFEDWKREKKADKLFARVCESLKQDFKKSYREIALKLADEFGDLFSAFENASTYDEKALKSIPEKWAKAITEQAKQSIKISEVVVKGDLILSCLKGNGILAIKEALKEAEENPNAKIEYISAPRYRIRVSAQDYEKAEKILSKLTETVIKNIKSRQGEGSFEKIKE